MIRRWAIGLGFVAAAALYNSPHPAAAADEVVVLSSYPEEMTAQFERAFAQARPDLRVRLLWQQGRESMTTLSKPDHGGVDVYWAPALFNFPTLAKANAFSTVKVDRAAVPGRIGEQVLSDPAGRFEAFEVAGYGIAVNKDVLVRQGLATPKNWDDLASPAFSGLVSMPVPSQIGFSPSLYDIILQKKGWSDGWALLSEIASNARLAAKGGAIIGPVADGEAAAALAIDFIVRTAIATGKPITLIYPNGTAFLPAHIAILADAPHPAAAQAFADFLLSAEGQRILFHPDVSRYPVRPAVYAAAPAGTVNPFAVRKEATFAYDLDLGPARTPLIAALFDAAITARAEPMRELWMAIHAAEKTKDGKAKAAKARARAGWVPVTDAEAADPKFLARFERRGDNALPTEIVATWAAQLDKKRAEALALLPAAPVGGAKTP